VKTPNNKLTIFKKGSTTYFYASAFFPKIVRNDVAILYAFVRIADDFVDQIPQDKKGFLLFKNQTIAALNGNKSNNSVIDDMISLVNKCHIKKSWVLAFLSAMELDLTKRTYKSFKELEDYMYGSAEVIGLMMAAILNLSEKSHRYAMLQGKAMQLINFIRDINEDISLGRMYIPKDDLDAFSLKTLPPKTKKEKDNFMRLVNFEIERYLKIQKEAEKGYKYIPKRYVIPIATAAKMYNWTAYAIASSPHIVFEKKVKPLPRDVIKTALFTSLQYAFHRIHR
jgi:15-cis-phytoene synthase